MKPIVFFVSSAGDTDLAIAAITKLIDQNPTASIYLVPVTPTAETRTQAIAFSQVKRLSLRAIVKSDQLDIGAQEKLSAFITQHDIQRAYIGVASPVNEELPYQIAQSLNIPCTFAYEYMFNAPDAHPFWRHLDTIAVRENIDVAVATPTAKEALLKFNPQLNINVVGHVSIDRALTGNTVNSSAVKTALHVAENNEMIFISGTTQKIEIDNQFLRALLEEIETGKYANIQIRFGLHPGISDKNAYMQTLLATCSLFPNVSKQLKIILPDTFAAALNPPVANDHPFIIRSNASGADVAAAADKVAQAVPGALLNEAAILGKPAYYHNKTVTPYLPEPWFITQSIHAFFSARPQAAHKRSELGVEITAGEAVATLMQR